MEDKKSGNSFFWLLLLVLAVAAGVPSVTGTTKLNEFFDNIEYYDILSYFHEGNQEKHLETIDLWKEKEAIKLQPGHYHLRNIKPLPPLIVTLDFILTEDTLRQEFEIDLLYRRKHLACVSKYKVEGQVVVLTPIPTDDTNNDEASDVTSTYCNGTPIIISESTPEKIVMVVGDASLILEQKIENKE